MKQGILKSLVCASLLTLVACTAKIEGGESAPPADPFAHKIQGPDLTGAWSSGCVLDSVRNLYVQKTIVFQGKNVARTRNHFQDSQCAQMIEKDESAGVYRWLKTTEYGGFQVEYKFDMGNGWSIYQKEEILTENGNLYLSDYLIDWGSISKDVPLTKVGN